MTQAHRSSDEVAPRERVAGGRVASGPERPRRWARTCDLYSGYAVDQQRAQGRQLQVVVLEPI